MADDEEELTPVRDGYPHDVPARRLAMLQEMTTVGWQAKALVISSFPNPPKNSVESVDKPRQLAAKRAMAWVGDSRERLEAFRFVLASVLVDVRPVSATPGINTLGAVKLGFPEALAELNRQLRAMLKDDDEYHRP